MGMHKGSTCMIRTLPSYEQNVPSYIKALTPYIPGKPIEETQREYKIKKVVKLASNENPLGPSPKALAAIRKNLQHLNRYPDGSGFRLKQKLSEYSGFSPQSVILGNGSNEIIDFLIRTYCVKGDAILTSKAAFIAYKICAQIHGIETVETNLTHDLKFDLKEMLNVLKTNSSIRLVFIANPNNPTGTYLYAKELNDFLTQVKNMKGESVIVALDYAYWEYIQAERLPIFQNFLKPFPNVIVLRTFSKIYGLAGLRMGYGVASETMISHLEKVRQPFNINSLALAAAESGLADEGFVKKSVQANKKGLEFWEHHLTRLEIPFWKSQGNFILANVRVGAGISGPDLFQLCLKKGVIFRPVANYGLDGALRISIGLPEENRFALKVLSQMIKNPS